MSLRNTGPRPARFWRRNNVQHSGIIGRHPEGRDYDSVPSMGVPAPVVIPIHCGENLSQKGEPEICRHRRCPGKIQDSVYFSPFDRVLSGAWDRLNPLQ